MFFKCMSGNAFYGVVAMSQYHIVISISILEMEENKTKASKTNSFGTCARLKSKLCFTLSIHYESVAQDVLFNYTIECTIYIVL